MGNGAGGDDDTGPKLSGYDGALALINGHICRNGLRIRDFFRLLDRSRDGSIDSTELNVWLKRLGVEGLTVAQVDELIMHLDKDSSGTMEVSELEVALRDFRKRHSPKMKATGPEVMAGFAKAMAQEVVEVDPKDDTVAADQEEEMSSGRRVRVIDDVLFKINDYCSERLMRVRDFFEQGIRKHDDNKDRQFNPLELRECVLQKLGIKMGLEDAEALVMDIDTDNDMRISLAEFERAVRTIHLTAEDLEAVDEACVQMLGVPREKAAQSIQTKMRQKQAVARVEGVRQGAALGIEGTEEQASAAATIQTKMRQKQAVVRAEGAETALEFEVEMGSGGDESAAPPASMQPRRSLQSSSFLSRRAPATALTAVSLDTQQQKLEDQEQQRLQEEEAEKKAWRRQQEEEYWQPREMQVIDVKMPSMPSIPYTTMPSPVHEAGAGDNADSDMRWGEDGAGGARAGGAGGASAGGAGGASAGGAGGAEEDEYRIGSAEGQTLGEYLSKLEPVDGDMQVLSGGMEMEVPSRGGIGMQNELVAGAGGIDGFGGSAPIAPIEADQCAPTVLNLGSNSCLMSSFGQSQEKGSATLPKTKQARVNKNNGKKNSTSGVASVPDNDFFITQNGEKGEEEGEQGATGAVTGASGSVVYLATFNAQRLNVTEATDWELESRCIRLHESLTTEPKIPKPLMLTPLNPPASGKKRKKEEEDGKEESDGLEYLRRPKLADLSPEPIAMLSLAASIDAKMKASSKGKAQADDGDTQQMDLEEGTTLQLPFGVSPIDSTGRPLNGPALTVWRRQQVLERHHQQRQREQKVAAVAAATRKVEHGVGILPADYAKRAEIEDARKQWEQQQDEERRDYARLERAEQEEQRRQNIEVMVPTSGVLGQFRSTVEPDMTVEFGDVQKTVTKTNGKGRHVKEIVTMEMKVDLSVTMKLDMQPGIADARESAVTLDPVVNARAAATAAAEAAEAAEYAASRVAMEHQAINGIHTPTPSRQSYTTNGVDSTSITTLVGSVRLPTPGAFESASKFEIEVKGQGEEERSIQFGMDGVHFVADSVPSSKITRKKRKKKTQRAGMTGGSDAGAGARTKWKIKAQAKARTKATAQPFVTSRPLHEVLGQFQLQSGYGQDYSQSPLLRQPQSVAGKEVKRHRLARVGVRGALELPGAIVGGDGFTRRKKGVDASVTSFGEGWYGRDNQGSATAAMAAGSFVRRHKKSINLMPAAPKLPALRERPNGQGPVAGSNSMVAFSKAAGPTASGRDGSLSLPALPQSHSHALLATRQQQQLAPVKLGACKQLEAQIKSSRIFDDSFWEQGFLDPAGY
jgi:Ca2+-binding EF-hand superfamily protein